jgi:hypothetical protein
MALTDVQKQIRDECKFLGQMLINKNRSYGSSFSDPIHIFSQLPAEEQLFVRIDDKLNRIKRGKEYLDEDTIMDLIGYLVLLRVLKLQEQLVIKSIDDSKEAKLVRAEKELAKSGIVPELSKVNVSISSESDRIQFPLLNAKLGDVIDFEVDIIPPPPPPPPLRPPPDEIDPPRLGSPKYYANGYAPYTTEEIVEARRIYLKDQKGKTAKMKIPNRSVKP